MPRCEDYPCCGHEPGDCPSIDSKGRARFRCVGGCGKLLPVGARSSICPKCTARRNRHFDEYGEYPEDTYGDY